MHTPQTYYSKTILVVFILNLLFFSGCGSNSGAAQNSQKTNASGSSDENTNKPSDSIEKLLDLVRLPVVPEEAVWREDTNADPKKLTAVFKFEKEELPKLIAMIEKNKIADSVEVEVENWFPEELTAQSQLSGEGMLKGTAYAANDFYNIPYGNGRITRIQGTDFFVLELNATN